MKLDQFNINLVKIDTGRLLLRPFIKEDLDDFYAFSSVPGVGESAGWKHHESREESEEVLNRFIEGRRTLAVIEQESKKVIGYVSFEASGDVYKDKGLGENINDVAYILSPEFWSKGYAVESLRAVLSYAFYVLHLDALTCGLFAENERSRAVIERCGFSKVAEEQFKTDAGEKTAQYFAITAKDFGVEYKTE